jgi:hypothetical protein
MPLLPLPCGCADLIRLSVGLNLNDLWLIGSVLLITRWEFTPLKHDPDDAVRLQETLRSQVVLIGMVGYVRLVAWMCYRGHRCTPLQSCTFRTFHPITAPLNLLVFP